MSNDNKKVIPKESESPKTVPTVGETKEEATISREELLAKKMLLEKQYQQLSNSVTESDDIIDNLKDRLLKQRENRQSFLATMSQLEVEYTQIMKLLGGSNK